MTRKDYVIITEALRVNFNKATEEKQRQTIRSIIEDMIPALRGDNPRFSSDAFRSAVFHAHLTKQDKE